MRRTVLDVAQPFLDDTEVELTTWCGGTAASAALRCTSLTGDRGGRVDAEMTWIHLGADLQPLRLGERFLAVYGESAAGRRASTRLELPGRPTDAATSLEWRLRATDVDRLRHVNNAAYWAPVEEHLAARLRAPHRAMLEYRQPLDLRRPVELRVARRRALVHGRRCGPRGRHTERLMPAKSLRLYLIGALVARGGAQRRRQQVALAVRRLGQLRGLPLRGRPLLRLAPDRPAGAAW